MLEATMLASVCKQEKAWLLCVSTCLIFLAVKNQFFSEDILSLHHFFVL